MNAREQSMQVAANHLAAHDPKLASVIKRGAVCDIAPHKDYYTALVSEIIGQQLSTKAARAIRNRFVESFGGTFPSPKQILGKSLEELRATGISWAKAKYVSDLAQHVVDGKVKFDHFDSLSNAEIIQELTAVKGIGEWTAHMFMMFCMGRLDILATGDLGIRNGIQQLYGLDHQPSAQEVIDIATKNHWHPYQTVACWYVWESLDNKPVIE